MPLDIKQLRKIAEERRFEAATRGEFPCRDRAWPRDKEKREVLDAFLLDHMRRKGVFRLKNGQYVLLGAYPDDVAEYLRRNGAFPEGRG